MLSARRATWSGPWRRPSHRHFYPHPPRGGRRGLAAVLYAGCRFLSTPSVRRATRCRHLFYDGVHISIHALREEGDDAAQRISDFFRNFYPRPPRGGRRSSRNRSPAPRHFYPRPPRGGRPARSSPRRGNPRNFYPRPPRGGRRSGRALRERQRDFYPRPPRGGRHAATLTLKAQIAKFLSTPSARRATDPELWLRRRCAISIHALREEGDAVLNDDDLIYCISIHALREEGDLKLKKQTLIPKKFLPPPSARWATAAVLPPVHWLCYFYPRPPRGGRRQADRMVAAGLAISIHALREEDDWNSWARNARNWDFYPRPPRGGRHAFGVLWTGVAIISIHALREEGDSPTT